MAPNKGTRIGKNRARGVLVPSILEKGINPLAKDIEGDYKQDEEDETDDFPEPAFKRRFANDDDMFDDASESLDEPLTTMNISSKINDSFTSMETSSLSSISVLSSTLSTPRGNSKSKESNGEAFVMLADTVVSKDMNIGLDLFFFVEFIMLF